MLSRDVREVEPGTPYIAVAALVIYHDATLPTFTAPNAAPGSDPCGGGAAVLVTYTPYECELSPIMPTPIYLDRPILGQATGTLHVGYINVDVDGDACADFEVPYSWYEGGITL